MRQVIAAAAAGVLMAGCVPTSGVTVVSSPYADGQRHTEPVIYNGRRYDVSFEFDAAGAIYVVNVAGKGRALGATDGDRAIVEQVASSAVRHFGCPTGQRGQIVPGSPRHGGTAWDMQVRCA